MDEGDYGTEKNTRLRDENIMKSTGIIIISIIVLFALMIIPAAADLTCVPNCPYIIAKGDTFTINWTGMNNGTATVMVIGRNHFHTLTAVPDAHGVFSVTLIPEVTRNFSSGQYALVVQDPGANGKFEIGTRLSETGHILVKVWLSLRVVTTEPNPLLKSDSNRPVALKS